MKMAGVFIVFTALLLCLPDFSDGNVCQSPPSLFESPGHSAELQCSHNITNYDQMYWYQQTRKGALDLIGYLSYTDVKPEEKFKKRFSLTGDAEKADFSDGINIVQSPPSLIESPGHSAELNCSHDDNNYDRIYWYHQTNKGALELIGYLSYKVVKQEETFMKRFNLSGDAEKAGPSQGIGVSQTPQVLLQGAQGSAGMFCEHDGDSSYTQMYWYRQLRGQGIQLLVFSDFYKDPEFEKDFSKDRYEVKRPAVTKGSLKIMNLEPSDSALYFCLFTDFSVGIKVLQSPPSLIESPGHSAELQCSHDDNNYDSMYWYQQTRKGSLELIGYLSYETEDSALCPEPEQQLLSTANPPTQNSSFFQQQTLRPRTAASFNSKPSDPEQQLLSTANPPTQNSSFFQQQTLRPRTAASFNSKPSDPEQQLLSTANPPTQNSSFFQQQTLRPRTAASFNSKPSDSEQHLLSTANPPTQNSSFFLQQTLRLRTAASFNSKPSDSEQQLLSTANPPTQNSSFFQ
ncbi:UNVERIFIED_CONTAM: hypothetical protein FKN15_059614 [Acipenser sinensis]